MKLINPHDFKAARAGAQLMRFVSHVLVVVLLCALISAGLGGQAVGIAGFAGGRGVDVASLDQSVAPCTDF